MLGTLEKLLSLLAGREETALTSDQLRMLVAAQCSDVGEGLSVSHLPEIDNHGRLQLGARVHIDSRFASTRLRTGPEAVLKIGDDARIGFGCALAADREIVIGDRATLGPYVFVVDSNVGDPDLGPDGSPAEPILIGDDVHIEGRATILKRARIGSGTVIRNGSVVVGTVPPNAVVAGNPAAVIQGPRAEFVHDPLFARVWLHPERAAIISDSGTTSYGQLWRRAKGIAHELGRARRAYRADGPVLFLCSKKRDFVACMYACSLAGVVAVPVPDGAARATVVDMAEACGAKLILSDAESLVRFSPPLDRAGLTIVRLESVADEVERYPSVSIDKARSRNDRALIMFTSGTTSKKKGVSLSHHNVLSATKNINAFMRIREHIREFVSVPLYHSFGLGRVRSILTAGGTLVVQDGSLNAAAMIQTIEREQVNALSAVPAGLALFSGRLEALLARIGPRIEVMELGSAFMSPEQKAKLLEIFPRARICMHYGLTEASRSTFLEFRSEAMKLATVGRPSPNVRIRIVDAAGKDSSAGAEGEIVIYGDHVLECYLGDEERTRASFTSDGGFRTGDYGYLDNAGYLTLLGRKDEMINKGGVKISPLELEDKVRQAYPELEFCVVGVRDPSGIAGHVAAIAYVGARKLELKEMLDALAQSVERSKLPDFVIRVDRIPRTDNGKPKRGELSEQLAQVIAQPSSS